MSKVEINKPAPLFTLDDFEGNAVSLAEYAGKKNVFLVFNRGFMWPFCQKHMAQLRQDYDKFVAKDIEIIVVGPEKASAFAGYWAEHELPYVGLPDPNHSVLKLYGQEVNLFKLGRMPAQVVIDKNGVALYTHYGKSMSDIPNNDELLNSV